MAMCTDNTLFAICHNSCVSSTLLPLHCSRVFPRTVRLVLQLKTCVDEVYWSTKHATLGPSGVMTATISSQVMASSKLAKRACVGLVWFFGKQSCQYPSWSKSFQRQASGSLFTPTKESKKDWVRSIGPASVVYQRPEQQNKRKLPP